MTIEYKTRHVGGLHPGWEYHLPDRRRCKSSLVWFEPDIPRAIIMTKLLPGLNELYGLEYKEPGPGENKESD